MLKRAGRWSFNDDDRAEFVQNDDGFYAQWTRSGKGITTFVRANRADIDAAYSAMLDREPSR
jgi:hypothetical protein